MAIIVQVITVYVISPVIFETEISSAMFNISKSLQTFLQIRRNVKQKSFKIADSKQNEQAISTAINELNI